MITSEPYRLHDEKTQRHAILRLGAQGLVELLRDLARPDVTMRIVDGLPTDVVFVGAIYEMHTETFLIRLASDDFTPVSEGNVAPYVDVYFRRERVESNG